MPPAFSENSATEFYRVEPDLSLGVIALKLYGHGKMAREIADWNHLEKPYRISIGQKLILKKPPLFSKVDGDLLLKNFWLDRLNLREREGVAEKSVEAQKKTEEVKQKLEEVKQKFEVAAKKAIEADEKDLSKEELSASRLQASGEANFKIEKYEEALVSFRKSRELDEEPLAPWLYEIRILKILKREEDAKGIARIFTKKHPEARDLPVIKPYLEGGS